MIRTAALVAALVTAGCVAPGPPPVTLPPGLVSPLADPGRQAINATAHGFASPAALAGRPDAAAALLVQVEFLAVELGSGQRWITFAPRVQQGFVAARREWRAALGIVPDAPPQGVIDALSAAHAALLAGDRARAAAALALPVFQPGGEGTLARLAALPPLPLTARAASDAQAEMWREQVQIDVD